MAVTMHLEVDWTTCKAHGMCYELFPEGITADDWGYPIVDGRPIPRELEAHAKRAAAACPTLALLVRIDAVTRG
jgi:ferredoxin